LRGRLLGFGTTDNNNVVVSPSYPPNKKFRADPAKAPSSTDKHKSPDEDVRRMEMEADAIRRSAKLFTPRDADGDSLLSLTPCETLKIEQIGALLGEDSCTLRTPRRASMFSRGKRLNISFDRAGIIGAL
jgi:hypothetical protein